MALENVATNQTFSSANAIADSIGCERVPTAKRRHGLPVDVIIILFIQLIVDKNSTDKGLGHALIADAFDRVVLTMPSIGAIGIAGHAIDCDAKAFYQNFDFIRLG
jgi:hypothetical protein